MADENETILTRKAQRKKRHASTGSIGSAPEASSTSPKDVLALGRTIVRQLEIARRGEVLDHWMAHHLAEVIHEAEESTGANKARAEGKAVDLILKLWSRRRGLPEAADPLGGYRQAIDVLGRLSPEANPWSVYRRSGSVEGLLSEAFRSLSSIVATGVLLTGKATAREVKPEEAALLAEPERDLHRFFDDWTKELVESQSQKPESASDDQLSPERLRSIMLEHLKSVAEDLDRIMSDLGRVPLEDEADDD